MSIHATHSTLNTTPSSGEPTPAVFTTTHEAVADSIAPKSRALKTEGVEGGETKSLPAKNAAEKGKTPYVQHVGQTPFSKIENILGIDFQR